MVILVAVIGAILVLAIIGEERRTIWVFRRLYPGLKDRSSLDIYRLACLLEGLDRRGILPDIPAKLYKCSTKYIIQWCICHCEGATKPIVKSHPWQSTTPHIYREHRLPRTATYLRAVLAMTRGIWQYIEVAVLKAIHYSLDILLLPRDIIRQYKSRYDNRKV